MKITVSCSSTSNKKKKNLIWHETANTAVQHAACFASAEYVSCYLALINPVEVPLSKNICLVRSNGANQQPPPVGGWLR